MLCIYQTYAFTSFYSTLDCTRGPHYSIVFQDTEEPIRQALEKHHYYGLKEEQVWTVNIRLFQVKVLGKKSHCSI